jgi:hypothetical protein
MTIVHWLCALFALAGSAPNAADAEMQPPPASAVCSVPSTAPAPLADWEQVLQSELADSPDYASQLDTAIKSASAETGVPPEVIWSVAYTETHGRHWGADGVVKRGTHGEIGLMQVKPFWGRALKRVYGIDVDLYNVADNVRAGAYILSRGGSEINVMLSYYNTGRQLRQTAYERRVMRYLNSLDDLAADAQDDELLDPAPARLMAAALPVGPMPPAAGTAQGAAQPADAVMAGMAVLDTLFPAPKLQPLAAAQAPAPAPQPAPAAKRPAQKVSPRQLDSRSHGQYDPQQDVSWAN